MTLSLGIVKIILRILGSRKRSELIRACKNPEEAQRQILEKILSNSLHPLPFSPVGYNFYEKRKVLTQENVEFFETTSGSTGSKKEIPYTRSFLRTFEEMFLIWANDIIFHSGIDFKSARFFMSISPKIGEINKDDRKYLSPFVSLLLSPFLASNPNEHYAKTGDEFLFKVAKDLVKKPDLEIISIWSPTYLLSLLKFMRKNEAALGIQNKTWKEIWPELKLISSWTHAQAASQATKLKEMFPGVLLQSKGLLLTEGAVTLPVTEAGGCVPLLHLAYFEFLDQNGKLLKIHELKVSETYVLIMSQLNGFLRYNTHDQVKVTGYFHKAPLLEFIGRDGQYSDLAGEKLSEAIIRSLNIKENFLIVPDDSEDLPRYQIFHELSEVNWDQELKASYHYNLAREMNQLTSPVLRPVKDIHQLYNTFFLEQGMVLGDIKERVLLNDLSLARKFLAWIDKELQSSH